MMNHLPLLLEDSLLRLVPLEVSDFEELYTIASDPLIWVQHPFTNRYKKEVFKNYFDDSINEAKRAAFKIVLKSSNKIIGATSYYDYRAAESRVAIGFTFLGRAYWGGHYNKPSKRLLIEHAFRFVDNIYFDIGSENIRSQNAILGKGAVKQRIYIWEEDGVSTQYFEYLIQKKDWK